MYGEGISKYGEMVDLAANMDIIHKSGSWFSYQDERIGQGRDNVKQYLKDNPEIAEQIEQQIREQLYQQTPKARARAAEKAVDVSADDFDDET